MIERITAGLALAAVIAFAARAAQALTTGGALAATVVGAVSIAAGWSWGALLLAFFFSSTALSHVGAEVKSRRTSNILEKGLRRDAVQVIANGGVFATAAAVSLFAPEEAWLAAGGGAIAAVTADTWATELGTLSRATPRLLTTWRPAPAGTSGAVTGLGTLGMLLGSAFLTLCMMAVAWTRQAWLAAFIGGVVGALVDSLAGATIQARRRCTSCDAFTERETHSCGARTIHAGGASWMTNDAVNLLCAASGASAAVLVMGAFA